MKILIISNMYPSEQKPYSGIFVKNQYEYLKNELKQDIDIYTMKRTFSSKLGSLWKYFKFYIGFTQFLFTKYDVVHIHFFGYHAFLAYIYKLFHPTVKLIITFHGSDTKNINKKLFQVILKKTATIVAVGKEQSEYIYKASRFKNIVVLPAGINEQVFYREETFEKVYDFIFIGSFYEIKGVDIFIEAIKKLDEEKLSYCFVGSGKFISEIKHLQGNYNVIIKENQSQSEIRTLLNQSSFLILPSRGDSFGLVVSESMYCGTPVIVSNIGGMKDQVKDAFNGYILEENNADYLAQKIEEVIHIDEKLYKKLSTNALESNKEYSMSRVCDRLLEIYKEVSK